MRSVNEWLGVVEPVTDSRIFLLVKFQLNGFEGLDVQDVVAIVKRGFFIIERREPHTFEVSTISLFPPHSKPHSTPLRVIDGFDNPGNFIDEGNCTSNVVEDWHLSNLLPGVRDVLQQLHDRVWNVLQGTKMNTLVVSELAVAHITMVFDDFADVLRRKILVKP